MTKLEELKAACDARADAGYAADAACEAVWDAYDDAYEAYEAELRKVRKENPMTKLEELKAAWVAAWKVYEAELKKQENSDD
jgi:hypothetical protein